MAAGSGIIHADHIVEYDEKDWMNWSDAQKYGYVQGYIALAETLYTDGLENPEDPNKILSASIFEVIPWSMMDHAVVNALNTFYKDQSQEWYPIIRALMKISEEMNDTNGYKLEDYIGTG